MDKIGIAIDAKVLYQMYEYAAYAETHFEAEVAGWGHYNKEDGIYKLAPLLPQIVSSAEVDTFPDQLVNNKDYDMSDMIVQWHSHVYMATNPSGTDKELIKDALELFPMLISIIVNCKHEYSARLDIRKVGADHCMINLDDPMTYDINLVPYYDNSAVNKEVKKKLRKPKPVIVQSVNNYGGNHDYGYGEYGYNNHYGHQNRQITNRYRDISDDYEPPANHTGIGGKSVEYKQILEKAELLEDDFPGEFTVYAVGAGVSYVRCMSCDVLAIINFDGTIEINGVISDWKAFLELTGASTFAKYYV